MVGGGWSRRPLQGLVHFAGGEGLVGRFVRAVHRRQLAQARAVLGEMRTDSAGAQPSERQHGFSLFALVLGQAIPLVDGDHQRGRRRARRTEHGGVWSVTPSVASSISTATWHCSIDCMVLTTENFSTTSSTRERRRRPAVSIRRYSRPSRSRSLRSSRGWCPARRRRSCAPRRGCG